MTEATLTTKSNPAAGLKQERRAAVRHLCNLDTLYQRGGGRLDLVWWIGLIRNLSAHGVGLLLDRRFEPGTLLTVALHSDSEKYSRTLEACVVHVTRQVEGSWLIGCAFAGQLSEAELQAILG